MNIKSSQTLVEEAQKDIETLSAEKVKTLYEKKEITLIDVRDIRELCCRSCYCSKCWSNYQNS